jgi:hypothetical protein
MRKENQEVKREIERLRAEFKKRKDMGGRENGMFERVARLERKMENEERRRRKNNRVIIEGKSKQQIKGSSKY